LRQPLPKKTSAITLRNLFFVTGILVLVIAFLSKDIIKTIEAPFLYNIMELEGNSATELLANASLDSIISQDIPYLQSIIEQSGSQNSNVIEIDIYSAENNRLAKWKEPNSLDISLYQIFSKTVSLEGETFGRVDIKWRTDKTIDEIERHSSFLSYVFIGIASVLVFLYMALTHLFIARPLSIVDKNLIKLNSYYGDDASGPVPETLHIGDYSPVELHHLNNTVDLLKRFWQEKSIKEQELVEEILLRKATEAELQLHRDSLQVLVDKKTIDLTHALVVAKDANQNKEDALLRLKETRDALIETEKMASLGSLVAGVGHEVNTPLSIVQSAISIIEGDLKDVKKKLTTSSLTKNDLESHIEKVDEAIKIAQSSTLRIINLMTSFKQIAVDQTTEDIATFNLYKYIDDVMATLLSLMTHNNVKFIINCDKELMITSIPGVYAQIITNLVNNSVKHGFDEGQGGILQISVIVLPNSDLQIVYQDDGKGMDKSVIDKIFEPFYTTARHSGGTGLGMSIVYNLVTQKLKGNIVVESQPNKGMKCIIEIPEL
jgi:signal transduction histidine kinase